MIKDHLLLDESLSSYFKTKKTKSFTKQLRMYHFQKTKEDKRIYFKNENFRKDSKEEDLMKIRRKKVSIDLTNHHREDNRRMMEEDDIDDIDVLAERLEGLENKNSELANSNSTLNIENINRYSELKDAFTNFVYILAKASQAHDKPLFNKITNFLKEKELVNKEEEFSFNIDIVSKIEEQLSNRKDLNKIKLLLEELSVILKVNLCVEKAPITEQKLKTDFKINNLESYRTKRAIKKKGREKTKRVKVRKKGTKKKDLLIKESSEDI